MKNHFFSKSDLGSIRYLLLVLSILFLLMDCKKDDPAPDEPVQSSRREGSILDDCTLSAIQGVEISYRFCCFGFFGTECGSFRKSTSNASGNFSIIPDIQCSSGASFDLETMISDFPEGYDLQILGMSSISLGSFTSWDSIRLKPLTDFALIVEPDSLQSQSMADSIHLTVNVIEGSGGASGIWYFRSRRVLPIALEGMVHRGIKLFSLQNASHEVILYFTRNGVVQSKVDTLTTGCTASQRFTMTF